MTLNPLRWRSKEWKGEEFKFKVNLHKSYVGDGKAVIGFLWGFIALFGIASQNVKVTLILGVVFHILCYFFGRYWYNHGWKSAEQEVNNRINPFVREMRSHVKNKRFK